ncbi:OB-fold protein [Massilia horti]|uniref:tRNA_anti-like n=1 Tax=Massilia horti TaxID=2562153 RepID=A0A4Y9T4T3_9BURK|nr:hypothetical protein [Massilia horti]TFW32921.1 hypothetical protein E4O92_08330 [Massilia horti]
MKKVLKWVGGGFLALIVLGVIVEATKSPEEKAADRAALEQDKIASAAAKEEKAKAKAEAKAERARKKLEALPDVTAHDIAVAYNENTVAADEQYKDKEFKVTGTVSDINTDLFGRPFLTLRGGVNEFMEPQFAFDKSAGSQLAKLKKGSRVTMTCTGRGDIAKVAMADDCTLVENM